MAVPVAPFHSHMVPSPLAEASRCPSRLNVRSVTQSVWPERVRTAVPVVARHSRMLPSPPVETSSKAAWERSDRTVIVCLLSAVCTSHMLVAVSEQIMSDVGRNFTVGGRLRVVSGDGQIVRAFEMSEPFVVQALDGNSTPLGGVDVTFFLGVPAPKSTDSVGSVTITTGPDGIASCPATIPILPGTQYVRVLAIDNRIDVFYHHALFELTVTER